MSVRRVALHAFALAAVTASPVLATSYSAAPMRATVVDSDTGEPLQAANVVAAWMVVSVTGRSAGNLVLTEALSGADGSFGLAGWGPRPIPSGLPAGSRLAGEAPELAVFKRGYAVKIVHNHSTPDRIRDPRYLGESVRHSDWDGKTIRLEKFKGGDEPYAFQAANLVGRVQSGGDIACPWLALPKAYRTLRLEKQRLDGLGVRNSLPGAARVHHWIANAKCPSAEAREFLQEYEK